MAFDLMDVFVKIGADTSELEQGISDAESKSTSAGSKIAAGLKTAGKVGVGVLAAVGTTTAAMGTALVKGAGGVAEYGDNIDKMSQKMGISAQAYQEWDAIMQHSGTSIESLKPSMKTLASAAEKGSDAFEKLGISQEEVASLSQEDLFAKVISGLQGMEEGTERTYITSQLLGRGAVELGALLNTSAEDTEAMRQKVHELGGVMSDEAVKAAAAYQDSLQDMQTGFDGLKRNMISDFLPAITGVMDGLTDIFSQDYDSGLEKISEGISNVVSGITEKLPEVLEVGASIVEAIASAIIENAPKIFEAGLNIILQLGTALIEALPEIASVAITMIQTLAQGIAQALPELIPTMVEVVIQIVQSLVENAPMLIDAALQLMQGLLEGIINAIPVIIEALPSLITSVISALIESLPIILEGITSLVMAIVEALPDIIQALVEAIPTIITTLVTALSDPSNLQGFIDAALNMILSLAQGLIDAIPTLIEQIPTIITALVGGLATALPQIMSAGANLLVGLASGIINALPQLVAQIPQIITAIVSALVQGVAALITAGGQLISGFWDGIKATWSTIITAIPKLLSGLIDAVKSLFGIHSPSKVFGDIGKNLIQGLMDGIKNMMSKLKEKAKDILNVFKDLPKKIVDTGKNIIEGLWKGMSNATSWIKEKISGWVGDVMTFLKGLFGIHSPSTLMRDAIGINLGKGVAVGIEDSLPDVENALNEMTDLVPEISPVVSVGNSGGFNNSTSVLSAMENEQNENRNLTVILELDKSQLAKAVYALNNEETQRVGLNLAGGYA